MPDLEEDVWLPEKLARVGVFIEVEKKIYNEYTTLIREWLEGVAEAVLTSAGIDPLGVYSYTSKWTDKLYEFVNKVITWALGKAYQWTLGESYEFTNRPFVQQYIEQSKNRLVRTPDEVYVKVKAAVAAGTAEGQSIPEIAKQIKTDILDAGAPYWKNRAVTVARTETIGAYNGGANDAFAEIVGQFPEDEYEKIWLATDDERTRHTHNEADGQRVPYSAHFSVGEALMAFPGDPAGPPQEVINCRCTMLLVEKGEEVDYSSKGFKGLTAAVASKPLPPPLTAPALIAAAVPHLKHSPQLTALIAHAWISNDWKLHATCATTFCRNPLHPGPCKGWKHTLKKVAPGVYDALEAARIAKLEQKRKAKITALKEAGKPIPKSLQNKITSIPTKPGPIDPTPDQKPLSEATEKKLADVTAKTKKAFEKKPEPKKAAGPIDGDGDGKLNEGNDAGKTALKNAKPPDAGDITDTANQAANMAFAPQNFTDDERIEAYGELSQADVDSMNMQDTSNLIDDIIGLQAQGVSPAKTKILDKVFDLINKLPDTPPKADLHHMFGPDGDPDHKEAVGAVLAMTKDDFDSLSSKEKSNVTDHIFDAYGNGEPGAKEAVAKFNGFTNPVAGVDSAAKPTSSVKPDEIGNLDGPNTAAVTQALDVTNNTYKYSFDQVIGAYTELSKKDFDSLTKVDQKNIAEKVKGFASSPILTQAQRDKAASLATSLGSKYPHGSGAQVEAVKAITSGDAKKILDAAGNLTKDEYTGLAEVHQKGIKDAVKVGLNNPDLTNSALGIGMAFFGGKMKPTVNIPSVNAIAKDADTSGTGVNAIAPPKKSGAFDALGIGGKPKPGSIAEGAVPFGTPATPPAVTQVKNVFDDDSKATDVAKFYAAKALTKEQFETLPMSMRVQIRAKLAEIASGKGDPKFFVPGDIEKANEVYKKFSKFGSDAPGYSVPGTAAEPDVLADLLDNIPVVSAPPAALPSKDANNTFPEWQTKKSAVGSHPANTKAGKVAKEIKGGSVTDRLGAYQEHAGTKAKFDALPVDVKDAIVADLDNITEGQKKGFFTSEQADQATLLRFTLTEQNPLTVYTPTPPPPKKAAPKKAAKFDTPAAQAGFDAVQSVGNGKPTDRLATYEGMTKDDFESLPATAQKQIATDLGNMAFAKSYAFNDKEKEYTADFGSGYDNPNKLAAKAALKKLIGQETAKGWKPKTKAQKAYEKLGDSMFAPGPGGSGTLGSSDTAVYDLKVSVALKGIPAQKAAPADMTNSANGSKWQGVYSTSQFHGGQMYASVESYKGSGYDTVNANLRANKGKLNKDSYDWGDSYESGLSHKDEVRAIDEVMKKSRLTAPIVTYRGFKTPEKVFPGVWNNGNTELTGMEFTDYGFQSTSTKVGIAENFAGSSPGLSDSDAKKRVIMRIVTPKGYGAIKVSGDEYESEVLLDRTTRYRVVRDNGVVKGARRIDVEVIGPGENG